jgi:hypothetical protein
MKAIGLDHRTRELAGFRRATMVNGTSWVTGKEIAAVLNTITIGTVTANETMSGTTTDTVITSTSGTIDSAGCRNR